jgi:phytoene synthase
MVTAASSEMLTPDKTLAVYGKSFHWARRFLGQKMGADAARLYQFCRILDDMADGDIENGQQRLQSIRKDFVTVGEPLDPLMVAFKPFLHKHHCSPDVVVALIDGLLSDQKPVRIKNEAELLGYAYRVAGTVGILMCDMLGCDHKNALDHAMDLGIAMQLTNIARDILEDAEMGRRYLPESWVGDLHPSRIITLAKTPLANDALAVTTAVEKLLNLADDYYKSGMEGFSYLPLRAHISIAIAAHVYRQIGVQLRLKQHGWHRGREVTSRFTKIICSIKALGSLVKRSHPYAQHNATLHQPIKGLPCVR